MRPAIWPYKINHSSACGRCDLSNKSCLVSYQLTYEPTEFPLSIPVFVSSKHSRILHSSFHQSFSSSWNETWALSVKTQRTGRFVFMWGGGGIGLEGDTRFNNAFHCVSPSIIFPWLKTSGAIYTMLHYLGRINRLFDGGGGGRRLFEVAVEDGFFFFLINFIFKFLLLFARTMF